jgi:hypothetical protein
MGTCSSRTKAEESYSLTPQLPPVLEALWLSYLSQAAAYAMARVYASNETLKARASRTSEQGALMGLAKEGWLAGIQVVEKTLQGPYIDWCDLLLCGVQYNHKEIVCYCEKKGAQCWDLALDTAAKHGHVNLMQLCEEKGAVYSGWTSVHAAEGGHVAALLHCEKVRPTITRDWDWEVALWNAAERGDIEMMLHCEARGAARWSRAASYAAEGGQRQAEVFCRERHAKLAAAQGHPCTGDSSAATTGA